MGEYPTLMAAAVDALGPLGWVIADSYDPGDLWASALMPAFVLNDVLADVGGRTNPTFRQAAGGSDAEAFGYMELRHAVDHGEVAVKQVETAERALDRWLDELRAAGLDY